MIGRIALRCAPGCAVRCNDRIDGLPAAFRTVFMLRAVEELSVEEVSAALGLPEATVRTRFFRARGVPLVVVRLGPDGAYCDGEGGRGRIAGVAVAQVVDTVGAGDGLAVGVTSALLEGRGVHDAETRGAWIGARAVQVLGDTEGLPTRAQLEASGL